VSGTWTSGRLVAAFELSAARSEPYVSVLWAVSLSASSSQYSTIPYTMTITCAGRHCCSLALNVLAFPSPSNRGRRLNNRASIACSEGLWANADSTKPNTLRFPVFRVPNEPASLEWRVSWGSDTLPDRKRDVDRLLSSSSSSSSSPPQSSPAPYTKRIAARQIQYKNAHHHHLDKRQVW
jgi:hypothetical protein